MHFAKLFSSSMVPIYISYFSFTSTVPIIFLKPHLGPTRAKIVKCDGSVYHIDVDVQHFPGGVRGQGGLNANFYRNP